VLIRTDEEGFEGPRMTRLDLREGDGVAITAPDIDAKDIEAHRAQIDAVLAGDQGSIIANFDIHVQAIGLSDRSDHPVEPFYKHLAPVEVVEVTERSGSRVSWVREQHPTPKVAWPARHFFSGLPEAGDRLIMSAELRKGSSQ